ncbi:MAG: glycosyltransferase [Candidatus Eisenbacteria bacterium]|nr:glycosyltransferase [Candidatus Eisenbacteria bacterium]
MLDEERFLPATLAMLLAQDLPERDYEVLVVDGGSRDGTRACVERIAAAHPGVRLLENPARVSSAGRNVGWRAARAPHVLFVDGHVHLADARLLSASLAAFEAGASALARAQPLDPPGLTAFQSAVAGARASWLGHQGGSEIYREQAGEVDPSSSGAAYRRDLLERLGGYDERFDACEDVEFNERVKLSGLRARTEPAFTVRYYPRESLPALWRQCERYGRGRARLWRKHPRTLGPTVPVPTAYFAAGILLALAAVMAHGPWPAVAAAWWAPYVAAVLLASAGVALRGSGHPLLPLIFAGIHLGFAWGFARELIRPGARFTD